MTTKKAKKEAEVKAPKVAAETQSAPTTQAAPSQPVTDLSIGDLKNLANNIVTGKQIGRASCRERV